MTIDRYPHCDSRILHGPQDGCEFCDAHPDWQELRKAWGIAFTGHVPAVDGDRCGKRYPDSLTGKSSICMLGAGHDAGEPHSDREPYEVLPCPADYAVQRGTRGDHRKWPGNTPGGYAGT